MTAASRGAAAAAWWPWLLLPTVAGSLTCAGFALVVVGNVGGSVPAETWVNMPLAIGFSIVAAGIWATAPHPRRIRRLGAVYTVIALGSACVLPAHGWGLTGLAGSTLSAWISNWVWALGAAPLLGLGLLLYPDGELPGARWRPAAVLGIGGTTGLAISGMLRPGPLEVAERGENPVGVADPAIWDSVGGISFLAVMAAAVLGLAALVVKFRRATRGHDVRGQIGVFAVAAVLVVVLASVPIGTDPGLRMLSLFAGTALPAAVGMAVVRHRLLDQRASWDDLHDRVDRLSASRLSLVTEREEERVRLRRELHDGLGPSLAAIGLGLRQLEARGGDDTAATVRALADEVQRAVLEVRRICDGLRPAALNELGLRAAAEAALAALHRFGPEVEVTSEDLPALSPAVEVAAFRIAMEAATNAVRHADADRVRVHLGYDEGVEVSVEDDGHGLPADAVPGVGLRTMRQRAEEVGGWLRIDPGTRGGTLVRAWLPEGLG